MPRTLVYSIALLAFLGVTAMTIASIFVPNWISYSDTTPSGDRVVHHIGLHKSYSSTDGAYKHFPNPETCAMDRYFCSMWRSVGFLTSFAAVAELVTLVSFVMVLTGGKQQRESGWKVICYLLTLVALIQLSSMSIVSYLYDNDDKFFPGWSLSHGFFLCTASWVVSFISAAAIALSVYIYPEEGDYELIPSEYA